MNRTTIGKQKTSVYLRDSQQCGREDIFRHIFNGILTPVFNIDDDLPVEVKRFRSRCNFSILT
jgi:hypothetical protein